MRAFFIFLLLVLLLGSVPYVYAEEEGWFGENIFPIASKVKEAIDEAMKGTVDGIEERIMKALIPETGIGGGTQIGLYYPQLDAINSRLSVLGSFSDLSGGILPGVTIRYSIVPVAHLFVFLHQGFL